MQKRLNVLLYCEQSGEQIILPVNPESFDIKYEKSFETFDILGFGQVNVMGNPNPIRITFSHFLPEDGSIFAASSRIVFEQGGHTRFIEYAYSQKTAVEILKKWAFENRRIRVIVDDELNIECAVVSFTEKIRESSRTKPCALEVLEYRNPTYKTNGLFGLIKRASTQKIPAVILAKKNDTLYSLADKYGLDFLELAKNNGIQDVNAPIEGKKLIVNIGGQ